MREGNYSKGNKGRKEIKKRRWEDKEKLEEKKGKPWWDQEINGEEIEKKEMRKRFNETKKNYVKGIERRREIKERRDKIKGK